MTIYSIQETAINANNVHSSRYMSFYDSRDKAEKAISVMALEELDNWKDNDAVEVVHHGNYTFDVNYYHDIRRERIDERRIYHIVNVEVH